MQRLLDWWNFLSSKKFWLYSVFMVVYVHVYTCHLQPRMYQVIKKHFPLVDQYAKKLINEKVVTEDEYKVVISCLNPSPPPPVSSSVHLFHCRKGERTTTTFSSQSMTRHSLETKAITSEHGWTHHGKVHVHAYYTWCCIPVNIISS